MKRFLLFGVIVVVSLVADQLTKIWAAGALQYGCQSFAEGKTARKGVKIAACRPEGLELELPSAVQKLGFFDGSGSRWSATCPTETPCFSGRVKVGEAPAGAKVDGKAPVLKPGQRYTVTTGGGGPNRASTFRFLFSRPGPPITVIDGYFDLRWVENPGATFGFLSDSSYRTPVLIGIAALAVIFILWLARKLEPGQHLLSTGLALVLSGAIGNLIDRARLSYVIDFLDLHLKEKFRWPTFNVADIAIVVGVGLLLIDSIRSWRRERREKQAKQEKTKRR